MYRLFVISYFLFFHVLIVQSQNFQSWKNLTKDNVILFIQNQGYDFDLESKEEIGDRYQGKLITDNGMIKFLTIYINNNVVRGMYEEFQYYDDSQKIEGLDIDWSLEKFKYTVEFAKNNINQEGGYDIIKDNNNVFETDWKKVKDGKKKSIVTIKEANSYAKIISYIKFYLLDEKSFEISGVDILDIDTYNLESMVDFFLRDLYFFGQKYNKESFDIPNQSFFDDNVQIEFISLEGKTIALAYGFESESEIVIKVDPVKWQRSSIPKRWYVLYHELGHDKLNFSHGQGSKMMFNFVDKDYTWEEFFEDRQKMFEVYYYKRRR